MFKAGELTHVLNDSGAKVVITQDDLFPIFESIRKDVPSVEAVIVTSLGEYLPDEPYPEFPWQSAVRSNHPQSIKPGRNLLARSPSENLPM